MFKNLPRIGALRFRGLSLIELMIVIAVLGALLTIAIPTYQKFQNRARRAEVKKNLPALAALQAGYSAEHGHCANTNWIGEHHNTTDPVLGFEMPRSSTYFYRTRPNVNLNYNDACESVAFWQYAGQPVREIWRIGHPTLGSSSTIACMHPGCWGAN